MDDIPDALTPSPFDAFSDRERSYTPTLRGSSASPGYTFLDSPSEAFDLDDYLDPGSYSQDQVTHAESFESTPEDGLNAFVDYGSLSFLEDTHQYLDADPGINDDLTNQQDDEEENLEDWCIIFPPVLDSDAETDEDGESSSRAPLYYEDGNVVIRVVDGDQETVFRLHASVLASHSTVFKWRFKRALEGHSNDDDDAEAETLPSEMDWNLDDAKLEGMYLELDLAGVNAEELGWVFRSIYDTTFFKPPPVRTELKYVLGILAISAEYGFEALRKRAINHLEQAYPTTFRHWEDRSSYATFDIRREYGPFPFPSMTGTVRETIAIIRAALDAELDHLLPSALYELCGYDFRVLVGHSHTTDGLGQIMASPLDMLGSDELQRQFLLGRDFIKERGKQILQIIFDTRDIPPCSPESRREHCKQARLDWVATMSEWAYHRPFEAFSRVEISKRLCGANLGGDNESESDSSSEDEDRALCDSCQGLVLARFPEAVNDIWRQLPAIFGIRSNWEDFPPVTKY